METIAKLFGSETRVKVIKLFLFNQGVAYDLDDISNHTKESENKIKREISLLERIHFVKRKSFAKSVWKKIRDRREFKRIPSKGWIVNENFQYLVPLQTFLVASSHLGPKEFAKRLSRAGSLKLLIVAGVFIQDPDSRVDLLVVGDHLKKSVIESIVHSIEADMGKEIRYAIFETTDFLYRHGMYDKLVRDILDLPHERIIDKLNVV